MKKQNDLRKFSGRSARLIAAGTLAVSAASGMQGAFAEPKGHGSKPDAQTPTVTFDIPAGPLATVLDQFRKASGMTTALHLPPEEVSGFRSKGVRGTMTNEAALTAILEGSGLGYKLERAGTRAEIQIQNQEQVSVIASTNSTSLGQFTESLTDTAQTVNVIPQYILQEQAVTSFRDSLRNAPGISLAAGEAGQQGDNLTIRGFTARNDIYLDGIRDFGNYYRDAFDYESVDVLQGPASVEFGRGSTGGLVNQESKQPVSNSFIRPDVQFGTNGMRRGTLDINVPLNKLIPDSAFRVNLMGMETGVSERDVTNTRRWGIAPSLAFGIGRATRYSIQYLHEYENSIPDYGLPYFGLGLANVARTNFYGFKNFSFINTAPDVITGRVEHDFNAKWTMRSTLRFATYPRYISVTEPQINTAAAVPTAAQVAATFATQAPINVTCSVTAATPCYPLNTPLSNIQIKRNNISRGSVEDMLWERTELTGHLFLDHIENNVTMAIEGGRERSNPYSVTYTLPAATASTSLLNPNFNDAFQPVSTVVGLPVRVNSQSYGIDFMDTLKLRPWLILSGGVRFDYFNTRSFTPATATAAAIDVSQLNKQPTYRAAVVVKPRTNGTVYFDYGTSFNPSAESLSLSANNATLPPEYNTSYEVGSKWDLLHDKLNLNGSIFQTTKLNAKETDPTNSANVLLSGTQRVRGVQIGAVGHLPHHMDVIAGYAYLDGIVLNSILNASPFAAINQLFLTNFQNHVTPTLDPRYNTKPFFINPSGNPFANVPKNSGNLWVTHALPFRFVGGFGSNYIAARRASSTAEVGAYATSSASDVRNVPLAFKAIPGYWTFSAMLSRPITERLTAQVNINNLSNKFFIDQPHPGHLVPGEGINAQFNVNYRF